METINSVNDISKENLKTFSFRNMRKETAGETYKCWNKLLKSKAFENVENLKEIVSPRTPLSAFDEKLRLILIDSLQLKNEVINVFLSQDDYSIKRILRCKWFFQHLSVEFCTREIFPRVSISLRYKIINRLSKYLESEREAEKFFTYIQSNFDSEEAEILLPKCSSEFILNYCSKIRPLLEHSTNKRKRVLWKICLRYPETGLHILSVIYDYKKENNPYELRDCNALIQYYAGNHVDLFIPFFKKYAAQVHGNSFSRKLSRKLGKRLKDFLLESKQLINKNILNENYLFSMLDTNDQIQFLATIVQMNNEKLTFKNWIIVSSRVANLIKSIPPSNRLEMITAVFKKVYNLNFKDHSKCWSQHLLEVLSPKERKYFIEILEGFLESTEAEFRENVDTMSFSQQEPESLICWYEFDIAFDKLKNIIVKTPDKFRRQSIISRMVKCCSLNRDAEGLEKVVEFVGTRHRTDDPEVVREMAHRICSLFPFSQLTLNICQKLVNLLLFCIARGFFDSYSFTRFTERAIFLCWDTDKQADDLVKKYFEFSVLKCGNTMPFLRDQENKHSRRLLLTIGEEIKQWLQTHPTDHRSHELQTIWIYTCDMFNNTNKNSKVVLGDVPGMADTLKDIYKTSYADLGVDDWPVDVMEKCDIRLFCPEFKSRFLCYLLKKNPEVIIRHLDKVPNHLGRQFYHFLKKNLIFLGGIDKLKEITLNDFQKGDNYGRRTTGLLLYSQICTIEEFTSAVEEYIPHEDNVKEGADVDFTQIQLIVPTVIKNIRPRWRNLNLILKFFRGDFLKPVRLSFYASCYHSRVDFILPFLKEHLFTVPQRISYTKDIIRLICEFSNRSERVNFCLKCWQDNKHYSIRRIILQHLSKMFVENPSRDLFKALAKCLLESEEMIVDVRPDLKKIPDEYVNEYTATLWKLSKNPGFKENFQRTILFSFNLENINLLSEEFCEEIIRENLFNPKSGLPVERFATFYCVAQQDSMNKRIEMILQLTREGQTDPQTIASFLNNIRNESAFNPDKFTNVFEVLLKNWPEGLFEEKLYYLYHDMYYKILQSTKEPKEVSLNFGKQLRTLYTGMKDVKDLTIIILETLREFVSTITRVKLPLDPLLLVKELLDSRERALCIIAINALPRHVIDLYREDETFNADGDKTKLNEIVETFENMNDDVLWVYFRRTFGYKKPVK